MVKGASFFTERRKVYFVIAVFLLFYILVSPILGDLGLKDFVYLKKRHNELMSEISRLEKENSGLKEKITALKGNSYEWERLAREKLDMVKNSDFVYKFR